MVAEICFEAPEITTNMGIMIDARVSIVTVSKLIDVSVTAGCKCPDGSSGITIPTFPRKIVAKAESESESEDEIEIEMNVVADDNMVHATVVTSDSESEKEIAAGKPQAQSTIISKKDSSSSSSSSSESDITDSVADAKTLTDASSISEVSMSDQTILPQPKSVNISGTLQSPWKQENVLGKFTLSHEDQYGRPVYVRDQVTSSSKKVYLYHIHESKKWRVGPSETGTTCWLFVTSKVPRPELIDEDVTSKRRTWHEHSSGKWIPIKDMKVTKA